MPQPMKPGANPRAVLAVSNLRYVAPDGTLILDGLDFTLNRERVGLVGRNGAGKTTLLRLLAGELLPTDGSLRSQGRVRYLPQLLRCEPNETVADLFAAREKIEALAMFEAGHAPPGALERIGEDWSVRERVAAALLETGLSPEMTGRELRSLSGGELVRARLAAVRAAGPDLLLLDEPTNHLDGSGREVLHSFVREWRGGLLVVSHDRELLSSLEAIWELDPRGLRLYGGDYDSYLERREIELAAADRELQGAEARLKRAREKEREAKRRQAKRISRGRSFGLDTGMGKMARGILQRQAEATMGRLKDRHSRQVEDLAEIRERARAAVPDRHRMTLDLAATRVAPGKRVLLLENVNLRLGPVAGEPLWSSSLAAEIRGAKRVALRGANGVGKSLLLKSISGDPRGPRASGRIEVGVASIGHLDQAVAGLREHESLLATLRGQAPHLSESEARIRLGRFLFEQERALKPVSVLSGGERMRAGLACILARKDPAQLLLLDEPTNNLDLDSIEELESALSQYQGALLVVSHDERFLANIGIDSEWRLSREGLTIR